MTGPPHQPHSRTWPGARGDLRATAPWPADSPADSMALITSQRNERTPAMHEVCRAVDSLKVGVGVTSADARRKLVRSIRLDDKKGCHLDARTAQYRPSPLGRVGSPTCVRPRSGCPNSRTAVNVLGTLARVLGSWLYKVSSWSPASVDPGGWRVSGWWRSSFS